MSIIGPSFSNNSFNRKYSASPQFGMQRGRIPLQNLQDRINEEARNIYRSPERKPNESNTAYQGRRLDTWDKAQKEAESKLARATQQQHLEVPLQSQTPPNKGFGWGWLSPRGGSPAPKKKFPQKK